jgi:hypothetical protein
MMDDMPADEGHILAAFVAAHRWIPPSEEWTRAMPSRVVTVSDCLAGFEPAGQDPLTAPWLLSLDDAVDAAGDTTALPLAMSVPAATAAADLAAMIEKWIGDVAHPISINLARAMPPPGGSNIGFEVLGFDAGRCHSWLCYGLIDTAVRELAIRPNEHGQLATLADAVRLTDLANRDRGTPTGTPLDVTWFPAIITAPERTVSGSGRH